jgi:hypothetical protein
MITINHSYNSRYYSDFQGQEEELKDVLNTIPPEYILEVKPLDVKPERVWWAIYTPEGLTKLQRVIGGGKVVDDETEDVSSYSILDKICEKIGHNPARCEILGDNGIYTLIKLPPVQRPKDNYYKAPCVIKVNNTSLEWNEVFDSTGTRLGKHVLARLIEEHL